MCSAMNVFNALIKVSEPLFLRRLYLKGVLVFSVSVPPNKPCLKVANPVQSRIEVATGDECLFEEVSKSFCMVIWVLPSNLPMRLNSSSALNSGICIYSSGENVRQGELIKHRRGRLFGDFFKWSVLHMLFESRLSAASYGLNGMNEGTIFSASAYFFLWINILSVSYTHLTLPTIYSV